MANEVQLDISIPSCLGAGLVAPKERRIFSKGSLTGKCPACDERLTLGRRGVLPTHPTKAQDDQAE
jgi:hypothetical protein